MQIGEKYNKATLKNLTRTFAENGDCICAAPRASGGDKKLTLVASRLHFVKEARNISIRLPRSIARRRRRIYRALIHLMIKGQKSEVRNSRRRLGQHWMTSPSALASVADALEISPRDTIVEIGPGKGALTDELRSKNYELRILAIEKDEKLAQALQKKYAADKNIAIIHGDILKVLPELPKSYLLNSKSYQLVGNIPYYITGAIIRLLTTSAAVPERAVLTMQKEVAERLTASPPRMNLLAAIAQSSADIKIIKKLPRGAFSPPPKVESAIVRFQNIRPCTKADMQYHEFIRQAFAHPRKTLLNNLRPHGAALLAKASLPPKTRAGELSIEKLRELSELWSTISSIDS